HIWVEIACRDILHDAHDKPAYHRAGNRVEPPKDHHGEDLEADQGEVHVHAQEVPPDDTAQGRHDAGHGPREAEVPLHVDPHGHGHLLVIRDRAHGDALARPEEEPTEAQDEDDAQGGAEQLDGRDEQGADYERLVADGQRQRLGPGSEERGAYATQDRGETDGGHDHGDHRTADELAQDHTLEREAEDDHAHEPEHDGEPEG